MVENIRQGEVCYICVKRQKLEHIDSARSCPSLQGLSLGVVSTPYCRYYVCKGLRGLGVVNGVVRYELCMSQTRCILGLLYTEGHHTL